VLLPNNQANGLEARAARCINLLFRKSSNVSAARLMLTLKLPFLFRGRDEVGKILLRAMALLAVVAAFVAYGLRPSAQEFVAPRATVGPTLSIGDRAKITFFEMMDVPSAQGEQQPALRTFYQRMDLTGEYNIQPDGSISFPRLGRFVVAGKSLQDVQADLAGAFERVMGRGCDVNLTIIEQQPIYVVGPVKSPGAYKYVPGMIVLQAVALAGGLDRGLAQRSQIIETMRESERMRQASVKMKRLLAQRARLDAEREDPAGAQSSTHLISMAADKDAEVFFASELTMLQLQRKSRQQHLSQLNGNVTAIRTELKALERRSALLDKQLAMRYERLSTLQNLMARGLETRHRLITAESEVADFEGRKQELHVAISQAEQKLVQTEEAVAKFNLEHQLNVEKESATIDQEIAHTQTVLASTEIVADVLKATVGHISFDPAPSAAMFQIVRRKAGESVVIAAQETTVLEPGDVLRVSVVNSTKAPSSGSITGRRAAYAKPKL